MSWAHSRYRIQAPRKYFSTQFFWPLFLEIYLYFIFVYIYIQTEMMLALKGQENHVKNPPQFPKMRNFHPFFFGRGGCYFFMEFCLLSPFQFTIFYGSFEVPSRFEHTKRLPHHPHQCQPTWHHRPQIPQRRNHLRCDALRWAFFIGTNWVYTANWVIIYNLPPFTRT